MLIFCMNRLYSNRGISTIHSIPHISMLKEFREFAIRGSVIDLAVGVIIGTAFGKIVTSVVNDLIMPMFVIVAYCIFLFVKQIQRFRKKKEDVKSTKPEDVQLLMEIRDLLKRK